MSHPHDPRLTIIRDRFEAAWASAAAPELADFLPADDFEVARNSVLIELVIFDLEHRWRANTLEAATLPPHTAQFPAKPTLEDYVARYPEIGPLELLPAELISEEYRVRRTWGDQPGHEEYLRRFPAQAAEVQAALPKIDSEVPLDDITVTVPSPVNESTGSEDATIPPQRIGPIADPSAGDRVRYFGAYELLEEIARGGMGVVFKARQVKLNRIVALKMILSGELAGEEEVQRFKTEAEAAANLDHPGIVPIYEIGEHQGQNYFSMGFVEGQSLSDRVKDGPLAPKESAEIVKKVAEAVAYAHGKGVIHRDLKPANVLLNANGEPRVTDFGLAKQVESDSDLTRTGAVMGTPSYMPPEQAGGKTGEVGPRSDVYSLGAILYCLLTGRPPFQSANPMDILLQVREKEPISPQALNPGISKDLDTVCLKCLQKRRESRYQSAIELSEDLSRFLNNEPIRARPVSKLTHGWRWCQRNPVTATLLMVVFSSALLMFFANTGWAVVNVVAGIAREGYFRPKQEANNLKQLDLAIRNYQAVYPPSSVEARSGMEPKASGTLPGRRSVQAIDKLFHLAVQTQDSYNTKDSKFRRELIVILRQYYEDVLRERDVVEVRSRLQTLERLERLERIAKP